MERERQRNDSLAGRLQALASPANRLLLLLFAGHYFNRTVVFPLRIRGGKVAYSCNPC